MPPCTPDQSAVVVVEIAISLSVITTGPVPVAESFAVWTRPLIRSSVNVRHGLLGSVPDPPDTSMLPLIVDWEIVTGPFAHEMFNVPVYGSRVTPAGTPVLDALGHAVDGCGAGAGDVLVDVGVGLAEVVEGLGLAVLVDGDAVTVWVFVTVAVTVLVTGAGVTVAVTVFVTVAVSVSVVVAVTVGPATVVVGPVAVTVGGGGSVNVHVAV